MSTIKVDTIATRTGSGNITASNTIAGTSATLSGTLGVTGATSLAGTTVSSSTLNMSSSLMQFSGNISLPNVGACLFRPSADTIAFGINNGQRVSVNQHGLLFGTDTAASNALDDYEEGTWTIVNRSIASITITNSATAQYRKVGSLVFISFYITYPSTSDSNNAKINLPFAAAAGVGYSYCTGRFSGSAKSTSTGFLMQMNQGSDETTFYPHTAPQTAYINSEFSGRYLIMSGCYIAA